MKEDVEEEEEEDKEEEDEEEEQCVRRRDGGEKRNCVTFCDLMSYDLISSQSSLDATFFFFFCAMSQGQVESSEPKRHSEKEGKVSE